MNDRQAFNPLQAQQVAETFNAEAVEYLFFAEARSRAVQEGIFPVANLRDIIASKKASGRMKDRMDLHLLELFRIEFESKHRGQGGAE